MTFFYFFKGAISSRGWPVVVLIKKIMKGTCIEVKKNSGMQSKRLSQNIKDLSDTLGIIGFNMGFRAEKV